MKMNFHWKYVWSQIRKISKTHLLAWMPTHLMFTPVGPLKEVLVRYQKLHLVRDSVCRNVSKKRRLFVVWVIEFGICFLVGFCWTILYGFKHIDGWRVMPKALTMSEIEPLYCDIWWEEDDLSRMLKLFPDGRRKLRGKNKEKDASTYQRWRGV